VTELRVLRQCRHSFKCRSFAHDLTGEVAVARRTPSLPELRPHNRQQFWVIKPAAGRVQALPFDKQVR
jgi:hypothetical protein